jgi:alanyl-tRNA synthetase
VDLGDAGQLKNLCFQLKNEQESIFAILGTEAKGKPLLNIVVSEHLTKKYGIHAGNMIREIAQQTIRGGGGGQPFFASAGGSDASGLEAAIELARKMVKEKVQG